MIMMRNIFCTCLIMGSLSLQAQYVLKEAEKAAAVYRFNEAIPLYEKAYRNKPSSRAARGLATVYASMRNHEQAARWYDQTLNLPGYIADDIRQFINEQMYNGKYDSVRQALHKYADSLPAPLLSRWYASCDSAAWWMAHPVDARLQPLSAFNTAAAEWGAFPYKNNHVMFSSDRAHPSNGYTTLIRWYNHNDISLHTSGWTGRPYLQLFTGNPADSNSVNILPDKNINSGYHSGGLYLSLNGDVLFFTSTRDIKGKNSFLKKDQPYTVNMEIFSSIYRVADSSWTFPANFKYNNPLKYSVGDPFLTEDGRRLYFVSDMPGGLGGTDIYYADKQADNTWGNAVNMGDSINSTGDERFPFISTRGHLYFSSNGRVGMGGLDIYKVADFGNAVSMPVNMGYPVNSPQDDFAAVFTDSIGYLSSDRTGGKGSDDLYSLTLENYRPPLSQKETLPDKPVVIVQKVVVPLPEKWILEDIYFDFDKWNIRPDATIGLSRLATIMKQQPAIRVQLGAYTDCRGSNIYNQVLSEKRAGAAASWLESKGISPTRIKAVGYGESNPVNRCVNGVICTEAEHQQNRRVEVRIDEE